MGLEVILQAAVVEGDQEPGRGAVGVRDAVGVQGVLGGGDQGVPQASPVVARIPHHLALVARLVIGGRLRAGEREEGGCEEGAVLGRAAAADPDPTGAVGGDREVAVEVRGAFLTLQGGLEPPVDGVGVDDLDDVSPGPGEVGGVQMRGLGDQDPLAATPDPAPRAGGRGRRRR